MSKVSREIRQAMKGLGLADGAVRELSREDARVVVDAMLARFIDEPSRTWWWEGFTQEYSVVPSPSNLPHLLREVVPDPSEKLYLLSTPDSDSEISVFEASSDEICKVIWDCSAFEFVVLHPSLQWLMCESHNNQFFAVGEPVKSRLAAACV